MTSKRPPLAGFYRIIWTLGAVLLVSQIIGNVGLATTTYQKGAEGFGVVKIQERLKELGYYQLEIDGRFGRYTEVAVSAFQSGNGLNVTGIVGEETWTTLFSDSAAKPGATPSSWSQAVEVLRNNSQRPIRWARSVPENLVGTSLGLPFLLGFVPLVVVLWNVGGLRSPEPRFTCRRLSWALLRPLLVFMLGAFAVSALAATAWGQPLVGQFNEAFARIPALLASRGATVTGYFAFLSLGALFGGSLGNYLGWRSRTKEIRAGYRSLLAIVRSWAWPSGPELSAFKVGKIREWNRGRGGGYGFVDGTGHGKDAFLHYEHVSGRERPVEGDRFQYRMSLEEGDSGQRRIKATEAVYLGHPKIRLGDLLEVFSLPVLKGVPVTGTIRRWLDDKGYGFVQGEGETAASVFLHERDLIEFTPPQEGMRICYQPIQTGDGTRASDPRLLGIPLQVQVQVGWEILPRWCKVLVVACCAPWLLALLGLLGLPTLRMSFLCLLLPYAPMGYLTCLAYRVDKRTAQLKLPRTESNTLHNLEFLFGVLGAYVASALYRHKTDWEEEGDFLKKRQGYAFLHVLLVPTWVGLHIAHAVGYL